VARSSELKVAERGVEASEGPTAGEAPPTKIRNGANPETVGARVRAERLNREIGVRELARRVGVSASLISQVEHGKASPSVGTLYAIVSELELSVDQLLLDRPHASLGRVGATEPGPLQPRSAATLPHVAVSRDVSHPSVDEIDPVVRRGGGHELQLASGVRWERLAPQSPQDVDFLSVRYDIGGASCSDDSLVRHSGKEYGHVFAGRLGVTVAFDTYEMGPGDSISFDSTMPHRLFNLGDVPVEAIWFVVGRHDDPRINRGAVE
jgi:transcriptional regulator with XRE-family HTH domain/mannose-6-phosphate isomerase-like protein (cupin superfamily)